MLGHLYFHLWGGDLFGPREPRFPRLPHGTDARIAGWLQELSAIRRRACPGTSRALGQRELGGLAQEWGEIRIAASGEGLAELQTCHIPRRARVKRGRRPLGSVHPRCDPGNLGLPSDDRAFSPAIRSDARPCR